MSGTGLAIIYVIIWWIIFFAILPIDVNRTKTVKIDGEDPGSPENPKMIKKKDLPLKICITCERPFTWRKKWEKVWNEVKYCSKKCKKIKVKNIKFGVIKISIPNLPGVP